MDATAKRQMWDLINKVSVQRSVVITTHSMEVRSVLGSVSMHSLTTRMCCAALLLLCVVPCCPSSIIVFCLFNDNTIRLRLCPQECEAICSRIGIMVGGKLKCLGSSQRLKHKFGASYEINIRCPEEKRERCILHLQGDFDSSGVVEEEHRTYFRMKVSHGVDLSSAFRTLEDMKARGDIFEYSMSQSTLEQIFINFAKDQDLVERGESGADHTSGVNDSGGDSVKKGEEGIEMSTRPAA